jgi:hypothetical protein
MARRKKGGGLLGLTFVVAVMLVLNWLYEGLVQIADAVSEIPKAYLYSALVLAVFLCFLGLALRFRSAGRKQIVPPIPNVIPPIPKSLSENS